MVTAGGGGTSASRPASLVHQGAAAPLPLASLSTPLTPAASQLQATVSRSGIEMSEMFEMFVCLNYWQASAGRLSQQLLQYLLQLQLKW
jgi:hypothetical protein